MEATPRLTVVSFWTGNWRYRELADRLRRQCEALGLPHYIVERPDTGDWLRNTRQKPGVIHDALDACGPVLWIDADGGIFQRPDAIDYTLDWMAPERTSENPPWRWHVGVQFFNDTPRARELLDLWYFYANLDRRRDAGGDDWALELVYRESWPRDLRFAPLPPEYHHVGEAKPDTVACIGISQDPGKLTDPRRFHVEYHR